MARINMGVFSAPRGSIANITFSRWKRTNYAKQKIQKNTSNTPSQQKVRSAFAIATALVKPLYPILKQGFSLYTDRMSAYNAAVQYTIKNSLTPENEIDYSKVLISCGGSLSPAVNTSAYSDERSIVFEWDTNESSSAYATDKSLVALINPTNNEVVFNDAGVERSTGIQTIRVSPLWSGQKVHAYIGFITEDKKDVATSVYLGEITIA